MNLAQLQNHFCDALRYQGDADRCNIVEDHFSSESRIQIYRNNFIFSLCDVLKATYRHTVSLVGHECFEQLAKRYIITTPPISGDVNRYGDEFWLIFSQFNEVVKAAPYLEDVARLEWQAEQLALHSIASDSDIIPLSRLHAITENQQQDIQLCPHNNLHSYCSSFAIFDLLQAIENDDFSQVDIYRPQQGVIAVSTTGRYYTHPLGLAAVKLLIKIEMRETLTQIEPQLLDALLELTKRTFWQALKSKP